jgi:hypothetical protein
MENIEQAKKDLTSLLKIKDYKINDIQVLANKYSVAIEVKINGTAYTLHQRGKNLQEVADRLTDDYAEQTELFGSLAIYKDFNKKIEKYFLL